MPYHPSRPFSIKGQLSPETLRQLQEMAIDRRSYEDNPKDNVTYDIEQLSLDEVEATKQKIDYNLERIGFLYDVACQDIGIPKQNIGSNIRNTVSSISQRVAIAAQNLRFKDPETDVHLLLTRDQQETAKNALQELRLLTETYRLFIEGNQENLEIVSVDEENNRIEAMLHGVVLNDQSWALHAAFQCGERGIKVNVEYEDPKKGTKIISGRMDYHLVEENLAEPEQQAHLNLQAPSLTRTLKNTFRPLDIPHHLTKHFEKIDKQTFNSLRRNIWGKVSANFETE